MTELEKANKKVELLMAALKISEETCTCAAPEISGEDHKNFPLCPMGISFRVRKELAKVDF